MATPSVPPGGGTFAGPAAGAPLPPGPPPHGWDQRRSGPRRGRGLLGAIGIVVALLLGAAALVVALTGVGRQPAPGAAPRLSKPTSSASTDDADRALCEAIAPLLRESAEAGKNFVNLGHSGTPERDAGIPQYRANVEDWVGRIQPILDAHAEPPRFLTRTTQQFIDYTLLYAETIRPGEGTEADAAAWNNRVVAYGGPFYVCHKLGVQW